MLEREGTPVGFVGMLENEEWMTTPFIGVDVHADKTVFRRLVVWTMKQALERGKKLHMSAGAARFKELRGAVPVLEAMLVFNEKESVFRRRIIGGASVVAQNVSPSIMASRF